jgi:putative NADH-flavin reductase
MKVIVFGASGKTGLYVVQACQQQGLEVTAFVRTPAKLDHIQGVSVQQGDVFNQQSVSQAIADHDAVIVCLGSVGLKDTTTLTTGTKHVLNGMQEQGVSRLVALSAAGVGDSWSKIPLLSKILFKTLLKNIFADHVTQEEAILQTDLDWTIVRAAILKDKPATNRFVTDNALKTSGITRGDLGVFLAQQVTDTRFIKQSISITN